MIFDDSTLTLQKSRMPQIQGVKGEAVVIYREPLTTQEMRHHRLSRRVNNMAGFSLFVHITRSEFPKIAQEDRKVRLLLLFRTFCHVVYATLGSTTSLKSGGLPFGSACAPSLSLRRAGQAIARPVIPLTL
ncbi:MAG: hypothetical protein V3W17_08910 [Desulfobacteria bacterium]